MGRLPGFNWFMHILVHGYAPWICWFVHMNRPRHDASPCPACSARPWALQWIQCRASRAHWAVPCMMTQLVRMGSVLRALWLWHLQLRVV